MTKSKSGTEDFERDLVFQQLILMCLTFCAVAAISSGGQRNSAWHPHLLPCYGTQL